MSFKPSTQPRPGPRDPSAVQESLQRAMHLAQARIVRDRLKVQVPFYDEMVDKLNAAGYEAIPTDTGRQLPFLIGMVQTLLLAYAAQLADMNTGYKDGLETVSKTIAHLESPIQVVR